VPIKGHQAGKGSRREKLIRQSLTGIAPTSIQLNGAHPLWSWGVITVMYCGMDRHKLEEAD